MRSDAERRYRSESALERVRLARGCLPRDGLESVVMTSEMVSDSKSRSRSRKGAGSGSALLPSAVERVGQIAARAEGRQLAVLLDCEGALAPKSGTSAASRISESMRNTLTRLARYSVVVAISSIACDELRKLVGVDKVFCAASEGLEVTGPGGLDLLSSRGAAALPLLDRAESAVREDLRHYRDVNIERARLSISIKVTSKSRPVVNAAFRRACESVPGLRKTEFAGLARLVPGAPWGRAEALPWLLAALKVDRSRVTPIYVATHASAEDAFLWLRDRGIGIAVGGHRGRTAAEYGLASRQEVEHFLKLMSSFVGW